MQEAAAIFLLNKWPCPLLSMISQHQFYMCSATRWQANWLQR